MQPHAFGEWLGLSDGQRLDSCKGSRRAPAEGACRGRIITLHRRCRYREHDRSFKHRLVTGAQEDDRPPWWIRDLFRTNMKQARDVSSLSGARADWSSVLSFRGSWTAGHSHGRQRAEQSTLFAMKSANQILYLACYVLFEISGARRNSLSTFRATEPFRFLSTRKQQSPRCDLAFKCVRLCFRKGRLWSSSIEECHVSES